MMSALLLLTQPGVNPYPNPIFLKTDSIEIHSLISSPPGAGSARDDADFRSLRRYQTERTQADCARARYEVEVSLDTFFGPAYGPLSKAQVEAFQEFFELIRIDVDYFTQESKKAWHRPRPYFVDRTIEPCVKRETTESYPSGHAAISLVFARILALIYPEQAAVFETRAVQIGHDRILAGVHHPTDIEAGRTLGALIVEKLLAEPSFVKALQQNTPAWLPERLSDTALSALLYWTGNSTVNVEPLPSSVLTSIEP